MNYPCLKININKILHNARIINDRCSGIGISVVGVTKSVLGNIEIAETFKASGISVLGDSRIENLQKLRNHFGRAQVLLMLRSPMPSEASRVIEICDISLNTQIETIKIMADICRKKNKRHRIIVMIETDDRREGILPENAVSFCRKVVEDFKPVELYGLGTNARCISKKGPRKESLRMLGGLKIRLKEEVGIEIPVISGGNSSIWKLIEKEKLPQVINQVRIGETILFGHETIGYQKIEGMYQDCFVLEAEVIEIKEKHGQTYKAILALGIQDANIDNIRCRNPHIFPISQSSDHTVILADTNINAFHQIGGGSIISFNLNYFGLLSCMTSPFVKKIYLEG